MTEYLIVTRHAGAVEWLRLQGITGEVVSHATAENVSGRFVIGALPLHLITTIDLPGLSAEQRGQDLTPEQMDAAGAHLTTYKVAKEPEERYHV